MAALTLDDVLREGSLRAVYQPIVELDTGRTVAYEALARGPSGTALEPPMAILAAAGAQGRTTEVDWECRAAALRGALASDLRRPQALFLNVETSVISSPIPPGLGDLVRRASEQLRVVVEITERGLRRDPSGVLRAVERIRDLGWEIALDDVGSVRESLVYLPFLRPDVVKLDISLLQNFGDSALGGVSDAVAAERERRDFIVLAEGIETEEHVDQAIVLGATHGQGWLFGRPADRPVAPNGVASLPFRPVAHGIDDRPPIDLVAEHHTLRIAEKRLLIPTSRRIESRLDTEPDPSVLIGTFQQARFFSPATARRFSRYAKLSPFVGAFACGLPSAPAPGVRGAHLQPSGPLARHWIVAVMGPYYSAALVAYDLLDEGVPDEHRRFSYAVTHRRDVVGPIVDKLMQRIVAEDAFA